MNPFWPQLLTAHRGWKQPPASQVAQAVYQLLPVHTTEAKLVHAVAFAPLLLRSPPQVDHGQTMLGLPQTIERALLHV